MTFTVAQMMQIYSLIIRTLTFLKVKLTVNLLMYIYGYLQISFHRILKSQFFVIFHPVQKRIPEKVILFINNQSLTEENCIRYLGVYIDSNISWKSHINYIAKKIK